VIILDDFRSAVKCVPEKTASSYSGRGIPYYKACAENVDDGLTDAMCSVHADMMSIPLAAGFCPERWKYVIYVMLENIPGVVITNKLCIIQLLEADLNQVRRIDFARNITKLVRDNEGVISKVDGHLYATSVGTGLRHIKCVCDNSAAIIAAKITVIQSIFHRLESGYDLISTMKILQGNWCREYNITYEWVKGHADRRNEEPNKEKRLKIEADALCDVIRNDAMGPIAA
jgi:hypothetical protein